MHLNDDSYHVKTYLLGHTHRVFMYIDIVANGAFFFQCVSIDFLSEFRHGLSIHLNSQIALSHQICHIHLRKFNLKFGYPTLCHFWHRSANLQVDGPQESGWSTDSLVPLEIVIERALKQVDCVVIHASYIVGCCVHVTTTSFITCARWWRLGRLDN